MKTLQKSSFTKDTHKQQAIKADVVFGSPTKRCVGIGICQVNPYRSGKAVNEHIPCCQQVETLIHRSGTSDRLHFHFSRKKICKKMIAQQFAYSRFRIPDPLMLPDWLTEALELSAEQLLPGVYPVVFGEESIEVSIRIR
jgi:hypothetical protein